jgi:outer membrane protein
VFRPIHLIILTVLTFFLPQNGTAYGQPAAPLSLESYIALAKKQNPQVRISNAAVRSSMANRNTALSRLLPHVDANAQAGLSQSQTQIPGAYTGGDYSAGISANQLIFDFGKSWLSNGASSKSVDAARYDEQDAQQTIVLNATTAYFNYLKAQMLFAVAQDALSQYKAHLEQARALFETGKQARFTVTKAEVDVANAMVSVITTKNGVRLAKVQMDVAAGVTLAEPVVLTDSLDVSEKDISMEAALSRALDARPELVALKARCEAARLQLTSAKAALLPDLNANASYGYRRTDVTDWTWNYGVGVTLSASLYEGGALVASVRSASAAYDQATAQLDLKKQAVASEVQQYYYEKTEALERIAATKMLIDQAAEGLDLSQQRFTAGAAPSLEVTDAEATLAGSKSSHAQALFDYRTAHAKLITAMGGL